MKKVRGISCPGTIFPHHGAGSGMLIRSRSRRSFQPVFQIIEINSGFRCAFEQMKLNPRHSFRQSGPLRRIGGDRAGKSELFPFRFRLETESPDKMLFVSAPEEIKIHDARNHPFLRFCPEPDFSGSAGNRRNIPCNDCGKIPCFLL